MKEMFGRRYVLAAMTALLALLLAGLLAGCGEKDGVITSLEQLKEPGRTIGVAQGSAGDFAAGKAFPNAELSRYTNSVTGFLAVRQGKLDAYAYDETMLRFALANGLEGLTVLDETLGDVTEVGVGISRQSDIPDLTARIGEFLAALEADGTMEEMKRRWIDRAEETMPDIPLPDDPEVTLTVGTTGLVQPFSYYKGDRIWGFDIELATRLAAWLGTGIEFRIYDFDGIVPAAQTGAIDCILSNLNINEERREVIDFSQPIYTSETALLVRAPEEGAASGQSFFESLRESFERTFVREGRWRLIVSGLKVTVVISVLAGLFGSLLGFVLCMVRRGRALPTRGLAAALIHIIQGTPIVVLLLILYYVVFGAVAVSAVAVSVIGFSLNFGVYVAEMLRGGIDAVDPGQIEAAMALGYSRAQTFWKVTFPQAARHFLPMFKGEFIGMVKMTSVVGYIAVQDLTKASDIIRSLTMEAFFPLIVTALIYFVIADLMTAALSLVQLRVDPKRRPRAVKGVRPK